MTEITRTEPNKEGMVEQSLENLLGSKKITQEQSNWLGKLQTLFHRLVEDRSLWEIAQADTCREHWLHGEMYRVGFHIGGVPVWKGKKPNGKKESSHPADFSAPKGDPIIVGEVKFLWATEQKTQYQYLKLTECLAKTDKLEPLDVSDFPEKWKQNILEDYPRLRTADLNLVKATTLRVLVLVLIRVAPEKKGRLGKLLENMSLAGATSLDGFPKTDQIWIRVWLVDPLLPPE